MVLKKICLVLVLLIASFSSHAADDACSGVDLRTATCPSGARRLPPPRDQGGTNYCFAYALTTLYSYSACREYSALSTGILSNQAAIRQNAGATDEKLVTSAQVYGLNLGMRPIEADRLLRTEGQGPCLEQDFSSEPPQIMTRDAATFVNRFRAPAPLCSPVDNLRDLSAILYESWAPSVTQAEPLNCARQPMPNINLDRAEQDIGTRLHELLSRNQVAVLHVNADVSYRRNPSKEPPNHYVTIVGRRRVNGVCQFLLRDSNPTNRSEWQTDGDNYVWIPSDILLQNADEVIFGR